MARSSVCVAIPVRNAAKYLPEAIESVLGQSGVDLTVHVVDNDSDDDTVAVARRYESDGRVRVDVNERDIKYYGSLNRILAAATADYFVPFAGDDVMLPGNLARKLELLEQTGAGMVHSPALMIDESGHGTRVWPDHSETPAVLDPPHFFTRIIPHNQVATNAVVVSTEALRAIGGFDVRSLYASDWLTFMRLSLRLRVATIHEPLVGYRVHENTGRSTLAQIKGRDLPATLDHMFYDPAMPAAVIESRDQLMAAHFHDLAIPLHRDGIDTIAQGYGSYMTMGRRLPVAPDDPGAVELYRRFVAAAGLFAPDSPLQGVAHAPHTAEDAAALATAVEELGVRLARLLLCVDPERVDGAIELLEPFFGPSDLDVVLAPSADPLEHVTPGVVVLAPWGSELIAQAEGRRVPVYPYALPNPFDRRPDPSLWETTDPAACLP